jgi:hypothetical protein
MTSGSEANLYRTRNRPSQDTSQLAQPNTDNKTMGQNKNAQSVEWSEFTELNEDYSALSVKFPKNGCGVCLVGFLGNIPSSGCLSHYLAWEAAEGLV